MNEDQKQSDTTAHPVDTVVILPCPFCGKKPSYSADSDSFNWIGGWSQGVKIECCSEMTGSFGKFARNSITEAEAKNALITKWNARAI